MMKKPPNYPLDAYQSTLRSFRQKCYDNQIWFSLANKALLSALTRQNYFQSDDHLEVFMTLEGFTTLQSRHYEHIVAPSTNANFWYSSPFYIDPYSPIVIKINIIVPANIKKTERFYSRKNQMRQTIGYWNSNEWSKSWLKRWYYNLWGFWWAALVWEEAYTSIYSEKFQGFFIIDNFGLNVNQNWIPNLTFQTRNIEFLQLECPIIQEAETFLIKRYGWKWQDKLFLKGKSLPFNWVRNLSSL